MAGICWTWSATMPQELNILLLFLQVFPDLILIASISLPSSLLQGWQPPSCYIHLESKSFQHQARTLLCQSVLHNCDKNNWETYLKEGRCFGSCLQRAQSTATQLYVLGHHGHRRVFALWQTEAKEEEENQGPSTTFEVTHPHHLYPHKNHHELWATLVTKWARRGYLRFNPESLTSSQI